MSKKITITGPDGKQTVVTEEKRGCIWWGGTFAIGLFLVGLILVYPLLLIPTVILGGLIIFGLIHQRRKQ